MPSLEVVAANATSSREKHGKGDGKPCGHLDPKAASVTLPICHHCVHCPLLAGFCRTSTTAMGRLLPVATGSAGADSAGPDQ